MCFRQIRGSPIGNQISPILSSIAVCAVELCWHQKCQTWLRTRQIFSVRYVDNRFLMCEQTLIKSPAIRAFLNLWFYEAPVEVEPVDDCVLLGFDIDPIKLKCVMSCLLLITNSDHHLVPDLTLSTSWLEVSVFHD